MRKMCARVLLVGLIVACAVSLLPALAAAKDFYFPEVRIEITISADGSFTVDEYRTYAFQGEFSWATLWIPLRVERIGRTYAATVEDFAVFEGETPLRTEVNQSGDRLEAKWYYRARDEQRTFRIHYRVRGGIRSSAETTELYWQPIGSGWDKPASRAVVTVTLPLPVSDVSELLVYGHGPLSGNSEIVDLQKARFTVPYLPAGQRVEIRVAWPAGMVAGVSADSLTFASIREEESRFVEDTIARAETAQAASARQKKRTAFGFQAYLVGLIAVPLLWLAFFMRSWRSVGKDYKFIDVPEYYREMPSDLPPALVDLLRKEGITVTPAAFTATIFDLAQRGYLEIEDRTEEKSGLLGSRLKTVTFLTFKKETGGEDDGLRPFERAVLDFLAAVGGGEAPAPPISLAKVLRGADGAIARFMTGGRGAGATAGGSASAVGTSFSIDDLKSWLKKNPTKFQAWYRAWSEAIKAEGKSLEFVEPASIKRRNRFIAATIPSALLTLNPVLAVMGAILVPNLKRRSVRWARENEMWKALRRFLDDFSEF
ncbi:MAG: DUF2207 domain-containing protein, partial [Candidatus Aminicenantes bacterium]|nr:DUF2207 domain-containing protein [Candidatus Aminicenantes bacterium]